MMIETFLFLAAAVAAPHAATPSRDATATSRTAPAAASAILEMTYNAFVAVEESPALEEIARPAIFIRQNRERAIGDTKRAMPIS